MKARIRVLGIFILLTALVGCKSGHEAAGDKFLKAGDVSNAVMQYDNALKKGKVSSTFYPHYTLANIRVLRMRAGADPTADFLDALKDTVASLLKRYPNPQNEAEFAQALLEVGQKRLAMGSPLAVEGAFRFFKGADGLAQKPADVSSKISAARQAYVASHLKDVESDLSDAGSEASQGVLADYKMNQLAMILGEETTEMKAQWSKVRKQNLSTYLMYDLEGLVDQVDARINKYGMLMGIVKYTPGPKTQIQAKVWNGTSGPIEIDGGNFKLVDRKGNAYKSGTNLGAFKKKSLVAKGEESKTGGLSFSIPADAEPDYLELSVEGRVSRKYLP